ncbi:hypothetical protein HanIR_Chr15g0763421 [Helianthus annuus]|nr:hypothetical protein HanIR_Chr15g0763421 [Helianthus annuus]
MPDRRRLRWYASELHRFVWRPPTSCHGVPYLTPVYIMALLFSFDRVNFLI